MATSGLAGVLRRFGRAGLSRERGGPSDGELLESFIARRDGDAFTELVRRHGPMVLGGCRRLLRHEPDAEDALQAVFLVLARRAPGVRPRDRVGPWLYGVALRTTRTARRTAARRRAHERPVPDPPAPPVPPPGGEPDLAPLLDRELGRLPEKFRAPVVLCDLEGR